MWVKTAEKSFSPLPPQEKIPPLRTVPGRVCYELVQLEVAAAVMPATEFQGTVILRYCDSGIIVLFIDGHSIS